MSFRYKNGICDCKTENLPPQNDNFKAIILLSDANQYK